MRKLLFILMLLTSFIMFAPAAGANNIDVSAVSLTGADTSDNLIKIQFDLSWENSWRSGTNYDSAWVFVKYSINPNDAGWSDWKHVTLKTSGTNPIDFSTGTGTSVEIIVPSDKKGCFIQRQVSGAGTGSLDTNNVQLAWKYIDDEPSINTATDKLKIKVFAVEMVYIPQGSFYIGDGNGTSQSTGAFYQSANTAVEIDNTLKGTIKCGDTSYDDSVLETTGIGIDGDGGLDTDNNGTIDNADFPTGYNAFYMMKYEISQGQYRDFLNTLTRDQQDGRTASQANSQYAMSNQAGVLNRSVIRCPSSVPVSPAVITFGCDYNANGTLDELVDGEWIACNYINWADVTAYADWAGLRPMTELEFEKAARGSGQPSVLGEYAWGSVSITNANTLSNAGLSNEKVTETGDGLCNYNNDGVIGPLRCGFATTASITRAGAGASYYGVMELSGNLHKRPVTVGHSTGRSFTGLHGDGVLSAGGDADVANWPGTDAVGGGLRGGSWYHGVTVARVSYRFYAAYTSTHRGSDVGGRCVRASP